MYYVLIPLTMTRFKYVIIVRKVDVHHYQEINALSVFYHIF
jgi:hypothetical protein